MEILFKNPLFAAGLFNIFATRGDRTFIHFNSGGRSSHNYAHFQRFLVGYTPLNERRLGSLGIEFREALRTVAADVIGSIDLTDLSNEASFRKYGRTLVQDLPNDQIRCFKFQKKDESQQQLQIEKIALIALGRRPDLKSKLPIPEGVFVCNNVPEWVKRSGIAFDNQQQVVLVYNARHSYFTYIDEEPSDDAWAKGRYAWLHDSGKMIAGGIIPIDIPMYHNEEANRKYLPTPDSYLLNKGSIGVGGAGRLEEAIKKSDHPNVGSDGRRDVGDFHLFEYVLQFPKTFGSDLDLSPTLPLLIESNAIARVLLTDALLIISRLKKLGTTLDWKNQKFLEKIATALMKGQAQFLHAYSGRDLLECETFVKTGMIDWVHAARQLIFWSQNDDQGYLHYLNNDLKLPENLYDPMVDFTGSSAKNAINYHPDKGFQTNGNLDYGPYNGPAALDELERTWYILSGMAIRLRSKTEIC